MPRHSRLLATAALLLLAWPAAVAASPGMGWGQWTSPDLTFAECTARTPAALRAEGMKTVERYGRVWFGSSPGPVSATIVCYGLPTGAIVTIGAANEGNSGPSGALVGRLADRIFSTEKPTPTPGSVPLVETDTGNGAGSGTGSGTTTTPKIPGSSTCKDCPVITF